MVLQLLKLILLPLALIGGIGLSAHAQCNQAGPPASSASIIEGIRHLPILEQAPQQFDEALRRFLNDKTVDTIGKAIAQYYGVDAASIERTKEFLNLGPWVDKGGEEHWIDIPAPKGYCACSASALNIGGQLGSGTFSVSIGSKQID